jgi:hypothetical protein
MEEQQNKILPFPTQEADLFRLLLNEIKALKKELLSQVDCWMDKKAAAKYMGIGLSSFDKYRYNTNPKIKGYSLDGKTLYKKSDIDTFIRLYALKADMAA